MPDSRNVESPTINATTTPIAAAARSTSGQGRISVRTAVVASEMECVGPENRAHAVASTVKYSRLMPSARWYPAAIAGNPASAAITAPKATTDTTLRQLNARVSQTTPRAATTARLEKAHR